MAMKKSTLSVILSFLLLEFLVISTINVSFCDGSTYQGCIESERQALLRFKQDLKDASNRLASWIGDGDCCTWAGVVCDNSTGHVLELHLKNPFLLSEYPSSSELETYERSKLAGKINPSLLEFKHLFYIDLSLNDFEGIQIPGFLGSMKNLRYLNLSGAGFAGMIPHQLGNLSNLQYLDLSSYASKLYVENFAWLCGLSMLEHLDLSGVNLNRASDWLLVTNKLPSLTVLQLSNCQLHHFPALPAANFSSLAYLNLSGNQFDNRLIPNWIFSLSRLTFLDLASNNFEGPIPEGFQNLTSLKNLDLSSNRFNSSIPNWLYSFKNLEYLSLKNNSLQGKISSAIENLTSINTLDLSYNTLEGKIPRSMGKLCNLSLISLSGVKLNQTISEILDIFSGCVSNGLKFLDLKSSQVFGHLPSELAEFKNLNTLRLSSNSISGPIPISVGKLSSLKFLDLSSNKINGTLYQVHFANLTKLLVLYVSENLLTMKVNLDWIPPFQLKVLGLRSCHIGPRFPPWLHSQKSLLHFDISNSGIVDTIPHYLFKSPSQYVHANLSHNQIHGKVPNLSEATQFKSLHLNSNNLSGSLPLISSNMNELDLSNNAFSGPIFHFLCYGLTNESSGMRILKVGGNLLSGNLPDCWMNWQNLLLLNLRDNKFDGTIPTSLGTLTSLRSLYLRKNKLYGTIPMSLKNCTELIVLDIGENELSGNVPTWIREGFPGLMILNLRSNKFYGHLPVELCYLAYLQILDLAYNNLSGAIPRCINNFSAMVTMSSSSNRIEYAYQPHTSHLNFSILTFLEDALVVVKGKVAEYSTILNLLRSIDLSKNKFFGEIPITLTNLQALRLLNLSHNLLTRRIPERIGVMRSLESIDFSSNQLSGEIPQSISNLNFLGLLNLSNNNLIGKIPLSTQIQGFDASSFTGNELCGSPLPNNCTEIVRTPDYENGGENDGNEHEVNWFFVSTAIGFVVGFWSFIGPLIMNRRWRYMYCSFVDHLAQKFGIVK